MQTLQLPIVSRNWSLKPSQTPSRSLKTHIRGIIQGRAYRNHLLTAQCWNVWIKSTERIIWMIFSFGTLTTYYRTDLNKWYWFILLNDKLNLLMLQHVMLLSPCSSQTCANLVCQWQNLHDSVNTAKVQITLSWVLWTCCMKLDWRDFMGEDCGREVY